MYICIVYILYNSQKIVQIVSSKHNNFFYIPSSFNVIGQINVQFWKSLIFFTIFIKFIVLLPTFFLIPPPLINHKLHKAYGLLNSERNRAYPIFCPCAACLQMQLALCKGGRKEGVGR